MIENDGALRTDEKDEGWYRVTLCSRLLTIIGYNCYIEAIYWEIIGEIIMVMTTEVWYTVMVPHQERIVEPFVENIFVVF